MIFFKGFATNNLVYLFVGQTTLLEPAHAIFLDTAAFQALMTLLVLGQYIAQARRQYKGWFNIKMPSYQ